MPEHSRQLSFRAYALKRQGTSRMWDGLYDIVDGSGIPLRMFARVPSGDGFDDPALAILAAEIFADNHIDGLASRQASRPSMARKPFQITPRMLRPEIF